jgi:hypothetical protein
VGAALAPTAGESKGEGVRECVGVSGGVVSGELAMGAVRPSKRGVLEGCDVLRAAEAAVGEPRSESVDCGEDRDETGGAIVSLLV